MRRATVSAVIACALALAESGCHTPATRPRPPPSSAPPVVEGTPLAGARDICRALLRADLTSLARPRADFDDYVRLVSENRSLVISSRGAAPNEVRFAARAADCLLARLGAPADLRISDTGDAATTTRQRHWLAYDVTWTSFHTDLGLVVEISYVDSR